MSTAQQLGLIGNSVKVQSLPTASAETFGAGNRFYTLIGQQEGYITGHTYRTVVANDVYSWEDVAYGNYNMLDNIPVINQDLSATDFTPVANTYYRHTGATTDTFTQGVIYLYDTAYHKLGESGGGTTLNYYKFILSKNANAIQRAERIFLQSKGKCTFFLGSPTDSYDEKKALGEPVGTGLNGGYPVLAFLMYNSSYSNNSNISLFAYSISGNGNPTEYQITIGLDGTIALTKKVLSAYKVYVTYYNDTEIT